MRGPHGETAAAVGGEHRLLGVDHQIEHDLLHLVTVGKHLREAWRQALCHRDVGTARLVGTQRECVMHDVVDIDHHPRALPLARERQEVADDARRALGLAEDHFETAAGLVVGRPFGESFGPRQNRRERVVQFVRDA